MIVLPPLHCQYFFACMHRPDLILQIPLCLFNRQKVQVKLVLLSAYFCQQAALSLLLTVSAGYALPWLHYFPLSCGFEPVRGEKIRCWFYSPLAVCSLC